jgi:NAD(P)-dependent dehydrogenase (short-subunit alcohol dehydrogenase family)
MGGAIIHMVSSPAISGRAAGARYSIAKAGEIAITNHITLEDGYKNIRAHILALGSIPSEATFKSMIVSKGKKAATENSMVCGYDTCELLRIDANKANENFSFPTSKMLAIHSAAVLL